MKIPVSQSASINDDEFQCHAICAQGSGGQNVNKVSSAIHLRFDIQASSLPDNYKERLLSMNDHRITKDGIIVIKAQRFRAQEKNRQDAIDRLVQLLQKAGQRKKIRKPTRPGKKAKQRRMDSKTRRGKVKSLRGKVDPS